MPAAIAIRDDISPAELRYATGRKADRHVVCRLSAIANTLDGMSRERTAEQASRRFDIGWSATILAGLMV